jgi:hypothetical protein
MFYLRYGLGKQTFAEGGLDSLKFCRAWGLPETTDPVVSSTITRHMVLSEADAESLEEVFQKSKTANFVIPLWVLQPGELSFLTPTIGKARLDDLPRIVGLAQFKNPRLLEIIRVLLEEQKELH